jgi:hypothetical protein
MPVWAGPFARILLSSLRILAKQKLAGTASGGAKASVKVIGVEKLRRKFAHISRDLVSTEVLHELGNYLTTSIEMRTLAGKEIEGDPFEPYSPRYRLFRQRTGHPTTPNLKYTGGMLNALTYDVQAQKEQVKVFFMEGGTPGTDVSHAAKAFYLQDKRPFFGASLYDIEKLNEIYQDHVRGLLHG